MLKKTFIQAMFGSPFPWIEEFIDNVQSLGEFGWEWKIFTPNPIQSKGNVEIIPMTCEQFNALVKEKTHAESNFFITESGKPSVHITDYYVATGQIFEDYLKKSDFWGICNLDVVFGRLDHFVPDSLLQDCDVFTDDIDVINGVFSLFRNSEEVNDLWKEIPGWMRKLSQPPCQACVTGEGQHTLYGTDEYDLTQVMRRPDIRKSFRYRYPQYFPIHSHDRLESQVPEPKLEMKADGSLWELQSDVNHPNWEHARPLIGREVAYYHFIRTKKWPTFTETKYQP